MPGRRAVVTGANGFVGANLTRRLLADGCEVAALVRPGSLLWRLEDIKHDIAVHEVDIRDRSAVAHAMQTANADWVFHLAAHGCYSWQADMHDVIETNVLGALNVLDACLSGEFAACVVAGSSSEYGFKPQSHVETDRLEPNSAYAVAKASATMLWRYAGQSTGRPIRILRLYSIFGPWEEPRRLLPTLIVRGLDGRFPPLVDPATARDYVYVDDAIDALVAAAASTTIEPGVVLNVGTGVQTTLQDVVALAARVLDISAAPQWSTMAPRQWDTAAWVADAREIGNRLGWRPRRTFEEGFRAFVDWFVRHPRQLRAYEIELARQARVAHAAAVCASADVP